MARLPFADLITAIGALLPDNTTELITPAKLREAMIDVCDTFQPAGGGLTGATGGTLALTTTDQKLAVFDTALAPFGEVGVITADPANDSITTSLVGVHEFNATLELEGTNNIDVIATLYRDNVITPIAAEVSLRGNGNKVELTFGFPVQAASPGPHTFDVRVKVRTGSDSVLFTNNIMTLVYIPGQ